MRPFRTVAKGLAAAVLFLAAVAAPVWAAEPTRVQVTAPPEVSLGDTVTVRVAVTDGKGAPVAGAAVVLLSPATFGSASSEMKLGQAVTDASGRASFSYEGRREGEQTLIARFSGNGSYAPAEASVALSVKGSAQLYHQEAGVKVPGIGVWILVLLLSAFWSIYMVVMVHITLIARQGREAPVVSGGSHGR